MGFKNDFAIQEYHDIQKKHDCPNLILITQTKSSTYGILHPWRDPMRCPECTCQNPGKAKFCMECGYSFNSSVNIKPNKPLIKGERKYATVLFSDLSGYTAMTEKIDPEEVKDLMGGIFKKAGEIVDKYDGTVERFFGDEVMVLFGVPTAHEDDPVRAIHAASQIHSLVDALKPEFEKRNLGELKMHTGINTGLVITGDEYIGKGRHGLTGDTINLAKRLTGLAKPGEIIVGSETYSIARNHFAFEPRDPVQVKGKKDSVQTFLVRDAALKPKKTRKLHGVRADLVARDKEMMTFTRAANDLQDSKGSILCLYGFAGTGKSRLVEELKAISSVKWYEGFSFPYTKNVPFFPLITLLNDIFSIQDEESSGLLKEKIENHITNLLPDKKEIIPYIGTLYSLSYPEIEDVNPELWKSKLFDAVYEILSAVSHQNPVIICIEDLHWADASFFEWLRHFHACPPIPALFLYISRPVIKIFSDSEQQKLNLDYQQIMIKDLSATEAQVMIRSLLKSDKIPAGLTSFVETKTEGNPFYLEELINSLIESSMLIRQKDVWELKHEITEYDISSSIHGVISARIDRLETDSRRILQEAAVIGRSFFYEIIRKITEIKQDISQCLENLEGFDLIKLQQSKTDLEYMFKHALTQEVVYKGLLKSERQVIHEKIGNVIEQVFADRLPEFYESLAHHFSKGTSHAKAVTYLTKAGKKCLDRFAVNEADQYFNKAYHIVSNTPDSLEKQKLLIDVLNDWAHCYYYLGHFNEFLALFSQHSSDFPDLDNISKQGMFSAWQGIAYFCTGRINSAYVFLKKALKLGEKAGDQKVIAYACTWMPFACGAMCLYKEGIAAGQKAQKLAELFPSDQHLYFKSLAGLCWIYTWQGRMDKVLEGSEKLLRYGKRTANKRSMVMGYWMKACFHYYTGDMDGVINLTDRAIQEAADLYYGMFPRSYIVIAHIEKGEFSKANEHIQKVWSFHKEHDIGGSACLAKGQGGLIQVVEGRFEKGFQMIDEAIEWAERDTINCYLSIFELLKGKIYLNIVRGKGPKSVGVMMKNIGFIIKNVPVAAKKSEMHLKAAVKKAGKFEMESVKGLAYFELYQLKKFKKKKSEAQKYLTKAITVFEKTGAIHYLKTANIALSKMK